MNRITVVPVQLDLSWCFTAAARDMPRAIELLLFQAKFRERSVSDDRVAGASLRQMRNRHIRREDGPLPVRTWELVIGVKLEGQTANDNEIVHGVPPGHERHNIGRIKLHSSMTFI
jgi:hypothetical protein